MSTTVIGRNDQGATGHRAMFGLFWVAILLLGGLFVVDAIGALETDSDDCHGYGYGGGSGGYGCNPQDDAYLEVDQTVDLVDRQTVNVDGFRFDARRNFGVVQCADAAFTQGTPSSIDACDLSTVATGRTDANGSFSIDMRVRRIITTRNGGEIDCAELEANCVIAGGVVAPDGVSATEGAYAPIAFDPAVPPFPPPTLTVEVVEIDTDAATLLVHCSNATSVWIEVQLTQEIRGLYGSAFGYLSYYNNGDEGPPCTDGPTEIEVDLEPGSRRIGRGDATYSVYADASDGFEYVSTYDRGEIQISKTPPRPAFIETNEPGENLSLELLGISGYGSNQMIDLAVTCDRPAADGELIWGYVSVQVSQWAGLDRVSGYGNLQLDECDGRTVVSVPLRPSNGRLLPENAQLEASVFVESYDEETDEYSYDEANLAGKIRLKGRLSAELQETTANPDSRITIEKVTRTGVTGTIDCDGAEQVSVEMYAQQYDDRVIRDAYAFDSIECDETVEFDLDWSRRLSIGTAAVTAYAYGYTVNDDPDYPTITSPMVTTTTADPLPPIPLGGGRASGFEYGESPSHMPGFDDAVAYDHISYLWDDQQGITLRVKR